MKKILLNRPLFTALALGVSLGASQAQTTFFNDTFSNGSTTNQISIPSGTPTPTSTSYDFASSKTASPVLTPNELSCKISSATTSGYWEAQALFATNQITLITPGDYLNLTIVFTNSQNTLLAGTASPIWIGLFNSGSTYGVVTNWPVPFGALAGAGLTTAAGSPYATGNCALWQGYIGSVLSAAATRITTRPVQNGTGTTSANQELVGSGSGGTYVNPAGATLSTSASETFTLPTSGASTLQLMITLDPAGSGNLIISNALYTGAGTAGACLFSNIVKTSTVLSSGFDGLAFGAFNHNFTNNPQMDVSSISVVGQSTLPTSAPTPTSEPANVLVATNGTCQFAVTANGFDVSYQWYRNGNQQLVNGGNISGATSSQLIISPAGTADQFNGAHNGYYCVITGAGNFSTNTTTNTLTLINATNLVWADQINNNVWDINDAVSGNNWVDTNGNQTVFNHGDPVIFDDSQGNSGGNVNLTANFTAPASVTVKGGDFYVFNGPGSIGGPSPLWDFCSARVTLGSTNSYTGGTLVSNATAYIILQTYSGLGSGPVTFGQDGGQMEVVPSGGATTGIPGNINVADNFFLMPDTVSAFGMVLLGDLSGTTGKTLTLTNGPTMAATGTARIRLYGANTAYKGNLNLASSQIQWAPYGTGTQIYNGTISGPGTFVQRGGISYLNNQNTYAGGTYPSAAAIGLGVSSVGAVGSLSSGPIGTGPILLAPDSGTTGSGQIFASSNSITIGNAIQCPSGTNNQTLIVGGSTNLTFAGPWTLQGNDLTIMTAFPTRVLQVTNTGLTIFTGAISDGGSNYNFNLTGSGITLFNNTETWGGATTNSGGTMLVNGQVGPGAVVIATNAALGGIGTVTGPVTIQNGGTLAAGSESVAGSPNIGTLTINNTLTLSQNSTVSVKVSTTGSTHDLFKGITTANYAGTLNATNITGTPFIGETFTIFNAGTPNSTFANITGSPGPGLAWSFNAASGQLSVIQGTVPFTIPPYISIFNIASSTNLAVTITNAQSGSIYYLMTTTNLLGTWTAAGTNTAANANTYTFNITNAVNPKDLRQFFRFSNTNH